MWVAQRSFIFCFPLSFASSIVFFVCVCPFVHLSVFQCPFVCVFVLFLFPFSAFSFNVFFVCVCRFIRLSVFQCPFVCVFLRLFFCLCYNVHSFVYISIPRKKELVTGTVTTTLNETKLLFKIQFFQNDEVFF